MHTLSREESKEEPSRFWSIQYIIEVIYEENWRGAGLKGMRPEQQIKYQFGTVEVFISPPQGNVLLINTYLFLNREKNIYNVLLSQRKQAMLQK